MILSTVQSGVVACNLSNELRDLASVAKTEQDMLHMFDWSDDECPCSR